ncbi:MAG: hypothetical protein IJD63_01150 [Oscillospiraceae bacterium]|nr:hypothetical protein [Oscillospiraceae bacterium]
MKMRLIFILCAVMLLLTFTGCEFPWTTEPTEEISGKWDLEFEDGREVDSGKAQLSKMEVSEVLAALEPFGFDLDDYCTEEERAEWENGKLISYIASYEQGGVVYPYGDRPKLYVYLDIALRDYYELG